MSEETAVTPLTDAPIAIDPPHNSESEFPSKEIAQRTLTGLRILAAALVVGLLGDLLLRTLPWGINLALWITVLLGAGLWLAGWGNFLVTPESRWCAAVVLLGAGAVAWRASPTLVGLNLLTLIVALGLLIYFRLRAGLNKTGVAEVALIWTQFALLTAVNPLILLFSRIKWKSLPRTGVSRTAMSVARGLLIALPLLLIFAQLLMAADAAFALLMNNLIDLDLGSLVGHIFLTFVFTWLGAGLLMQIIIPPSEIAGHNILRGPGAMTLGPIEISLILGLLDLLFLIFVAVQFGYFFGGLHFLSTNETWLQAEYARRGFFELVTVAMLALPMLLLMHWSLDGEKKNAARARGIYRVLAGLMIVLLYVIMASALLRMNLYVARYGLTEKRLYTTAFMGWLAIIFAWFSATVLRNRQERFLVGTLVAALVIIMGLNGLNPDAFIVRVNADREGRTAQSFDSRYVTTLSADAVPQSIQVMPSMSTQNRRILACTILTAWPEDAPPAGWRTWNWSRFRAHQLVDRNREALESYHCKM